ncbi:cholin permease [Fusarium pseudocircinatum]|uniref:Cholin permease n=1 Tax=Fusarium pseudocircinatum TaxID=56676 RepID=A0A8H5PQN5_9HYPO|nr:cholin permease [Fusarium pseudocircinatum]
MEVEKVNGGILEKGDITEGETTEQGSVINASGHTDQLTRQYGLVGLTGIAVTVNNAWVVLGSSISVSILSGGISGVIYGLIVAVIYYTFIGLSISEFASSCPSSGGVYHWATIAAGPEWGRVTGFYTGWINFYGWMFGLASLVQVAANAGVQCYATLTPGFSPSAWHVYVAYLIVIWLSAFVVIFSNRLVPYTQKLGLFLVVAGGLVTIVIVAVMPSKHASSDFVWNSFHENNLTGWNDGVAFMVGILNGAFTIGTLDAITHMAEETKNPKKDLPRAIFLYISIGGVYALAFAIVLGYAISDLSVLQGNSNTFPLAGIYHQATGSAAATFALLFIILISSLCCVIGTVLTNCRTYWTLARDQAVPFSKYFSRVSAKLGTPVESTLFVAVIASGIGAIPLGSSVGFSNLTGSFIIITTVSYAIPIVSNVLSGRKRFSPGPFHLKNFGYWINGLTILLIVVFDVFFCFPFGMPFDATTMNYNSVILLSTALHIFISIKMAEILGLASSIITIVEVAGKLGTNTIRLKRLWDEVQDVPASIQRCIEQLEILAPAIEEMDHEFEKTRNMIQNDSAAKRSLEYSRKAVETLDTLVRDMETQISAAKTSRRLVAQLKVRIKRDVIEDHQHRLTSALQLLSLSQQTYLIALSRAQPEIIISEIRSWRDSEHQKQLSVGAEEDGESMQGEEPGEAQTGESQNYFKSAVSPEFGLWTAKKPLPQTRPGLLGSFAFQSYEVTESSSIYCVPDKARFFQVRVHMPWFIQRSWDLSVLRASTGWTFQLNTSNIRPWNAKIIHAVYGGEVEHIIKLLKNKEASIYDVDPNGNSLLEIAALNQQPEAIKTLMLMGMNISDIEPSGLFRYIYISFGKKNSRAESPMELARQWTTEIGGISSEILATDSLSSNDWRCLARKMFLEVPPLKIVHPHDGAFLNLTGILEALWRRQFSLLPFSRWVQNTITIWLEDLAAAGINLEEYMSLELQYSRGFYNNTVRKDAKLEIRPGARLPESGPSLVILSAGPRADDWSFSWDPCVEELSGEFWAMLEDSQIKVPGAWVDERTGEFECLMGDYVACWFRREETHYRNKSSMDTNEIMKGEHTEAMRLQRLEWPEIKHRKGFRVRGMSTCEEFSPYKPWFWV